jgi:hypothetical protein
MGIKRTLPRCLGWGGATLILSLSITFSAVSPAGACSCLGFVEALDFQNDFAAVFVGEVVNERTGPAGRFGDQETELTFDVETLYEGDLSNRALLHSFKDNGANCGFGMSGTVAVLAYLGEDQRLRTDGCSATPLDDDGVIRAALETRFGPGVVPPPLDPGSEQPNTRFGGEGASPVLYGAVLFVVVLGIGFGLVLRSDKSET